MGPKNALLVPKSAIVVKGGWSCAIGSGRPRTHRTKLSGQNVAPAFTI
jgi:hypothetical protein